MEQFVFRALFKISFFMFSSFVIVSNFGEWLQCVIGSKAKANWLNSFILHVVFVIPFSIYSC